MKKIIIFLLALFSLSLAAQQSQGPYYYSIPVWGQTVNGGTFDFYCHFGFTGGTVYIDQFQLSGVYNSSSSAPTWLRPIIFRASQLDSNTSIAVFAQPEQQANGRNWAIDSASPFFQSNVMLWNIPSTASGQPAGPRTGLAAYDIRTGDSMQPVNLWDSSKPPIVLHGPNDGICVSLDTESPQNLFYFSYVDRFHETIP